ncbi:MAG: tetratricopeptide repeat protein, partial [Myxococcales bacterium]|nr:tetratricopeptide repeat protein [Myxococcales bacterium]
AHLALGSTLQSLGHPDAAATVFSVAVWLEGTDGRARAGLAQTLIELDAYDEAEVQLHAALDDDPQAIEPWLVWADLHHARADALGSVEALQRAFSLDPRDRRVGLRLADELMVCERHHEAFSVLQELKAHWPDDGSVLAAVGRTEAALGRHESAIGTLRRAASLGADEAWAPLADLLEAHGRVDDAVEALRQAHRAFPDDGDVAVQLGEALVAAEQFDDAVKVLARAVMSNRDDHRLHDLLGRIVGPAAAFDLDDLPEDETAEVAQRPITSPSSFEGLARDDAAIAGDLSQFNLVDLLEFLRLNRRTGILRTASKQGVGELMLVEGRLAGASTTNTERLGDRLAAAGLVHPDALDEAVALQHSMHEQEPLGRILLEREHVAPADLRKVIAEQVMGAITEIVGWESGRFAFEADELVRDRVLHPALELDTGQIMLDVLRLLDERRHHASRAH